MAGHYSACFGSATLCQRLFEALDKKIPNLKYKQGKNKCSIGVTGARKIFAWVNSHHARYGKIEIWFLGDLDKTQKFYELIIRPRRPTEGSWAEYKARFEITNQAQLDQAVELLLSISCPVSMR